MTEEPEPPQDIEKRVPTISDTTEGDPPVGTFDAGLKEAQLFSQGLSENQLRRRAAIAEHDRNETFRNHFEKIALVSLWALSGLFALVILAWFWHALAPLCWHWLSTDQINKLQTLATGGIIAGIAAGHIKKRLG